LNKLRADLFENLVYKAADKKEFAIGVGKSKNLMVSKEGLEQSKALANYINAATGRGGLGQLERAAPILAQGLFSPRLMASRVHLLNPANYVKTDPFVRREMLRDMITVGGTAGTLIGLAGMAGAEVTEDPRSADFGKIKVGNTRVDMLGGFGQYIRLASQIAPEIIGGNRRTDAHGKVHKLGEHFGSPTRLDMVYKFFESKEAPLVSATTNVLKGRDFAGEKTSISKETAKLFTPMIFEDLYSLAQDDPNLLPLIVPGALGFGLQTYETKRKSGSSKSRSRKPVRRTSR
jgi:hypothetical protein